READGERDVVLGPGDFFVVPRGVEHLPIAEPEACVVLLEPATTAHTGAVESDRTVTDFERL
ncbi:MAG: mannose-6-phosphate isomerase, partial [Acidobacteriota bacterium]